MPRVNCDKHHPRDVEVPLCRVPFFIESIFRIPGIGMYFTQSAFERDYPMIMALTLLFATLIVTIYFVTDLVYAWIDPRVRIIGRNERG